MDFANNLTLAALAGLFLVFIFFVIFICAGIFARVWHWIDDEEGEKPPNFLGVFLQKIWQAKKSDVDDGSVMFSTCVCLFVLPFLLVFIIHLYPVAIGIALLCVIAYLARFARRHHKLFEKHLKDPHAHKKDTHDE